MTMGKDGASELKPTTLTTLEPALLSTATMTAASTALANVARLAPPRAEGEPEDESPPITAQVKGQCLVITNWSTLWSQPQLKGKLLLPLGGKTLKVSPDGITAELEFENDETAQRALRICRLAEAQAVGSSNPEYSAVASAHVANTAAVARNTASISEAPNCSSVQNLLSDHTVQNPPTQVVQGMWNSLLSSALLPGSVALHGGMTPQSARPHFAMAHHPPSFMPHWHYPPHPQPHPHPHQPHPGMPQQPLSVISGLLADSGVGPGSNIYMPPPSMTGMPMSGIMQPQSFCGMAMAGMAGPMSATASGPMTGFGTGHPFPGPMTQGQEYQLQQPFSSIQGIISDPSTTQPMSSQPGPLSGPISSLFPGMFSNGPGEGGGGGGVTPPDSLSSFMAK